MGIGNLAMLFGLAAVAVPVLVHLLRRRRHDSVAWGAMQFLPAGVRLRQRRIWDELPLLALRMALIALLVLALAGPYSTSAIFAPLAERPARDVVIILNGSYRMDRRDADGRTPWANARQWAAEHFAQLGRDERAALLVARRPPLWSQAELTSDRAELQARLDELRMPCGNSGLPAALAEAWQRLRTQGDAGRQEIVLLTDRHYFGWADDATRRQWEAVGRQLHADIDTLRAAGHAIPRLRVVDSAPQWTTPLPDHALGPLSTARPLAGVGQSITFTTALQRTGAAGSAGPARVRIAIDGVHTQDVAIPHAGDAAALVPIRYTQPFKTKGLHAITAALDLGDVPDALSADDVQHAVVEVVAALSVLLVEGDRQPARESSTYFLDKALAGSGAPGAFAPRIIAYSALTPDDILGAPHRVRPRVIVLADVPALAPSVQDSIETFLAEGGGVLVGAGPRVGSALSLYNDRLYRDGNGWLPARLEETAAAGSAVRPDPASFHHPALALFGKGFGDSVLTRWWRVRAGDKATVAARLTNGDAFLVEKVHGKGRAVLSSVPLDRGWDSPLPGTWEYPVLVHEIVTYLAALHRDGWLLGEGQPLRVGPPAHNAAPGRLVIETPEVGSKTLQVRQWPWVDPDSGAIGLYRVEREDGSQQFFVVPPDLREADDRRCTDAEWASVLSLLPLQVTTEAGDDALARHHELWWLCLCGVMALLCAEVWLTRRLALSRRPRHG